MDKDKLGEWTLEVVFITSGAAMLMQVPAAFGPSVVGLVFIFVGITLFFKTFLKPTKYKAFVDFLTARFLIANAYCQRENVPFEYAEQWYANLERGIENTLTDFYLQEFKSLKEQNLQNFSNKPKFAFVAGCGYILLLKNKLGSGAYKDSVHIDYLIALKKEKFLDAPKNAKEILGL
jgi:hypothetical protein